MRLARHILGIVIVLVIAAAGTLAYARTRDGYWLYVELLRLGGYDGCRCSDCLAHYSWLPPPRRFGCMPPPDPPVLTITGVCEAAAIGGFWVLPVWLRRRTPDPSLCPSCRYPRAGLPPQTPCPECGNG